MGEKLLHANNPEYGSDIYILRDYENGLPRGTIAFLRYAVSCCGHKFTPAMSLSL